MLKIISYANIVFPASYGFDEMLLFLNLSMIGKVNEL